MDNPSSSFMEEDAYKEDKIPIKTIYVGNLSSEITENELKEYFLEFGSVASVAFERTGSELGLRIYAFVTFEESESAAKALRLANHEILYRRVVVKAADSWTQPKEKDAKCKRNQFSLLDLNDDCLHHIASYLELRDFFNLSKTCQRLECGLEPIYASYKKLDFQSLHGLTLMQIREILYKIGPHVQHIVDSANFKLYSRHFEELLLTYCVAENIVSFEFFHINSLSLGLIQTFKNLKTVRGPITDQMSYLLSDCNLQNLHLYKGTDLTGRHLNKLSNLQNLNLKWCSNLRPEFFKNLCMKTKLVSLNIEGSERLDYSSIETLASTQTKLENLSISNDYFGAPNLSPLATLKNLKRLRIHCFGKNCDEFFQELAKHRGAELEVLGILGCPFDQKVEQAIYSLKKLKVLAVQCCKNITNEFLTKLAMRPLECLTITPLESVLEKDVLNLISKSETIKVIVGDANHDVNKRRLVLSAHKIIKKKERKYPFSLFTAGPCIIDGIFHEEPELDREREFLKIIRKLGYLGLLPDWLDFDTDLVE